MAAMKVVDWRKQLEAVVDIYFDGAGRPPEYRAYADGAFHDIINESKDLLSAVEPAPDGLVEPVACKHEPFEGRCVHCDVKFVAGEPAALTSRAAVLEEAAKICEATYPEKLGNELIELPFFDNAAECAAAIRAAKGK